MDVRKDEIDSDILGRAALEIVDFDPDVVFEPFEEGYRKASDPVYVVCKIPAERIADVHSLEDHGFRFVEFQMKLRGSTRNVREIDATGYSFPRVTATEDLEPLMELVSTTVVHDRINRDPFFQRWNGRNISGERYGRYILKSLASSNEAVHKLVDDSTGEIVAFHSHRMVTDETALLLQGGVRSDRKNLGVGVVSQYCSLQELKRKGVKSFQTHVSGANYPIVNLEVNAAGFRVLQSYVVLRKTYQ